MDKFANIKLVSSPLSNTNSPNYNIETHRSIVINKTNTEFQPKKLDFRTNMDSNFSNSNMFASEVFSNSSRNHMNESTVSYMRNIYKGIPGLSEDRLKNISQNFMKLYGSNNQITMNGVRTIQRDAQNSNEFQQNQDTVKDLFKVLDYNRDNRITKQDIMMAARRYLNFQKKQILYTPMVQERLAVARRLFKQFDTQKKGFLTEKQVPTLLTQTYKCLNKTFQATQEDVKSWMRLADGNNDGYVTLPQYEQSIIRALKKQGVKIYED